jgi:hypothetical protein
MPVLAFNLTAGNSGAVTVSSLSFQQQGVLSESAISGAYLTQNGQVVAQYSSLNNDVLTFSGLDLSIPAGQTVTLALDISLAQGLSAGNTVSFSLPSASDVTVFDSNNNAVTPSGSFPLNSNTFTVTQVSNPSLAYVQIASSSIGNSVTAGTQGNIVGAWTFNVTNDPVWLQNLNFHVIGSANVANLQNVKLLVNGTQVGATLPQVPANGMADFNATSTNIKLNTGSNNVQVVADIMGSPSDNFQFEILNNYDVLAIDSQYNVPVAVQDNGGDGTQVGIQTGSITLDQDANTPTGNIALGTSNTVLAKYDLYAAGEPVKVQWLDFNLKLNGVSSTEALSSEIQNVQIVDDAGNQVGTTINTPPTGASCSNPITTATAGGYPIVSNIVGASVPAGNSVYTDCFGSSGSPINYIVPANTTRVLSLEANIQTTANFNTITANLNGDTGNLQGMTSSQSASTSGVGGVALTLVTSSLTATQNNAVGTQNVSAGTTDLKIGSYALGASSAGGVNVNTVQIALGTNNVGDVAGTASFQNLKVLVNGTQFGTTQGTVANNGTYSFSGAAFNVPAGQTVNLDVYADTMSSAAGTYTPATYLTGFTGVGQTSYTSVSLTGAPTGGVVGQTLSFNGQPALTIAADSSNPPSGQIVQNSTGNTLAVYRFTETSNVENVKVTQLNVVDLVGTTTVVTSHSAGGSLYYALPAFSNVTLWNGSTELGTAASPVWNGTNGYNYAFNSFTNTLIVPQGNSVSLTLKGDAGSYTNGSMTDASTQTFEVLNGTTTGGSTGYPASSTLAVSLPSLIATSTTVSVQATAGGYTSVWLNVPLAAATTTTAEQQLIANGLATQFLTLPATSTVGSVSTSTACTVVVTGAGTTKLNASGAVFGYSGAITTTADNAGAGTVTGVTINGIVAMGATSNKTALVTLSNANGNKQTVLRSTLAVSATPVTGLPPASFQQIGSITLTANSSGDDVLNLLNLTIGGAGASTSTTNSSFLTSLVLKDPSGNDITSVSDALATTTYSATGTTVGNNVKTWTFYPNAINNASTSQSSYGKNALDITAGNSYTLTLWGDLSTIPGIGNTSQSLTASINSMGDLTYYDGSFNTNSTPSLIGLTTNQVPITVTSLQTGAGGVF